MTIVEFVEKTLGTDHSGHDLAHAYRVLANVRTIQAAEGGDLPYVEGCALLHDCLDSKLGLDTQKQEGRVYNCLIKNGYEPAKAWAMVRTMQRMSFHLHDETDLSLEDKIVRDADRLDALGKVGAERAIAYGKAKGRPLFSERNLKEIQQGLPPSGESTVAHFFDKLLILDRHLYTDTAKAMAGPLEEELIESLREIFASASLTFDAELIP